MGASDAIIVRKEHVNESRGIASVYAGYAGAYGHGQIGVPPSRGGTFN